LRTTVAAAGVRLSELWASLWSRAALRGVLDREAGASLVEYTLLLALIVLVALFAITFLGHAVANSLNNSAEYVLNP